MRFDARRAWAGVSLEAEGVLHKGRASAAVVSCQMAVERGKWP